MKIYTFEHRLISDGLTLEAESEDNAFDQLREIVKDVNEWQLSSIEDEEDEEGEEQ